MPQYCIVYIGGNPPASPEEGKLHMSKYMNWLASLGGSAVSPANPLKDNSTIYPDGSISKGGQTTMSGFTIIEARSIEAAIAIARGCPFLDVGGSLEVSEMIKMSG